MPLNNIPPIQTFAPPRYTQEFKRVIEDSNLAGQDLAFPKRKNPSVEELGLASLMAASNSANVFPFKDNSLTLTDIETPTTMLVLNKATSEIMYQTNKFVLQQVSKPNQERFQIIETFGQPSVYFYDRRTRIYTIQGILMDGENTQALTYSDSPNSESKYYWATAFQAFYDDHLRGTKLKEQNFIAALYVNNWFIKGYPIQLIISKESATMPQTATFQMTWVVESDNLLSKNKASWLYKNGTVPGAVATAINNYIDAIDKYEKAYDAWSNAVQGSNIEQLVADRNKAEIAVRDSLNTLRSVATRASNSN